MNVTAVLLLSIVSLSACGGPSASSPGESVSASMPPTADAPPVAKAPLNPMSEWENFLLRAADAVVLSALGKPYPDEFNGPDAESDLRERDEGADELLGDGPLIVVGVVMEATMDDSNGQTVKFFGAMEPGNRFHFGEVKAYSSSGRSRPDLELPPEDSKGKLPLASLRDGVLAGVAAECSLPTLSPDDFLGLPDSLRKDLTPPPGESIDLSEGCAAVLRGEGWKQNVPEDFVVFAAGPKGYYELKSDIMVTDGDMYLESLRIEQIASRSEK